MFLLDAHGNQIIDPKKRSGPVNLPPTTPTGILPFGVSATRQ